MGEEETTYIDLTPTNEAMATMLYQVATESTNAKDRAWARSNLIRGYANANWDTNQSESTMRLNRLRGKKIKVRYL